MAPRLSFSTAKLVFRYVEPDGAKSEKAFSLLDSLSKDLGLSPEFVSCKRFTGRQHGSHHSRDYGVLEFQ
jgi:hypothetical protein